MLKFIKVYLHIWTMTMRNTVASSFDPSIVGLADYEAQNAQACKCLEIICHDRDLHDETPF